MPRAPRQRSRVTNGSSLFLGEDVNGRSLVARRWADVFAAILNDCGGADALSEGERQMAKRITTLAVHLERLDAQFVSASGPDTMPDMELYGTLTDRLGRSLQRLGLKRVPKDVTPDLHAYAASYARQEAEDL